MQRSELKYHWHVAERVQQEFAERYPGKWHVIVGKQFGSFVTHESSSYVLERRSLPGCCAGCCLRQPAIDHMTAGSPPRVDPPGRLGLTCALCYVGCARCVVQDALLLH